MEIEYDMDSETTSYISSSSSSSHPTTSKSKKKLEVSKDDLVDPKTQKEDMNNEKINTHLSSAAAVSPIRSDQEIKKSAISRFDTMYDRTPNKTFDGVYKNEDARLDICEILEIANIESSLPKNAMRLQVDEEASAISEAIESFSENKVTSSHIVKYEDYILGNIEKAKFVVGSTIEYKDVNGELHSTNDMPAVVSKESLEWYRHGIRHRENGLPAIISSDNSIRKYVNGQLHSADGLPSWESNFGTKKWHRHGQLHREDGLPAVIDADGSIHRYTNDKLHSVDDLPSFEKLDGHKEWHHKGIRHRENGLPSMIKADGSIYRHVNDKLHSVDDLPSFEKLDGHKEWHHKGIRHRENDKPATIFADGTQLFYKFGELHREKGNPSIITGLGLEICMKNGKIHNDLNEPAVIDPNGIKIWVKNGVIHREEGAAIIDDLGINVFLNNGIVTNKSSPAIYKEDYITMYVKNGVIHRSESQGAAVMDEVGKFYYNYGVNERINYREYSVVLTNGDSFRTGLSSNSSYYAVRRANNSSERNMNQMDHRTVNNARKKHILTIREYTEFIQQYEKIVQNIVRY